MHLKIEYITNQKESKKGHGFESQNGKHVIILCLNQEINSEMLLCISNMKLFSSHTFFFHLLFLLLDALVLTKALLILFYVFSFDYYRVKLMLG